MNTRIDLYKISMAALLTVALNGCSGAGAPGAAALDIGSAVADGAADIAGAVVPVPFADVPFDLLAEGMQIAADYQREAARDEELEPAQRTPASSAGRKGPLPLIGQIGSGGNLQTGDVALPCDLIARVAYDGLTPQSRPCRGSTDPLEMGARTRFSRAAARYSGLMELLPGPLPRYTP